MENLVLSVDSKTISMFNQLKRAIITSLILGGIFLVLIFLYSLMGVILMELGMSADATSYVVGMMPFINGAFHADLGHLFGNLLILFLFLIPEINQRYDLKKLFWLSCVLSTLYIPIFVLGISLPMVGSSGVFMFLIGRFFFSRKWKIFPIILSIYVFFEIMAIPTNDGLAHIFHSMCTIIGIMTVTRFNKWIPEEINKLIA